MSTHSRLFALVFLLTAVEPGSSQTQLVNPNPKDCCKCIDIKKIESQNQDQPDQSPPIIYPDTDGNFKVPVSVTVKASGECKAAPPADDSKDVKIKSVVLRPAGSSSSPNQEDIPVNSDGTSASKDVTLLGSKVTSSGTNEWEIFVTCSGNAMVPPNATDPDGFCTYRITLGGCQSCQAGPCQSAASNNSAGFSMDAPLGSANAGDSAGTLRYQSKGTVNPGPAGIAAFVPSTFTVNRDAAGAVTSIVTPVNTIEVSSAPTAFDPNGFTIYHKRVGATEPFRTTTVSRVEEGGTTWLRSDSTFSGTMFRYQQTKTHTEAAGGVPASDTWTMESGPVVGTAFTPFRKEILKITETQPGTRIHREITQEFDAATSAFATTSDTATTWNKFAWGWEKTQKAVDPEGANLVSTWTYYQPGEYSGPNASTEGLGRLHTHTRYDGHQEIHTYWLNHHQTQLPFAGDPQGLTLLAKYDPANYTTTTTKTGGGNTLSLESERYDPATNTRIRKTHTSASDTLTTITTLVPYGQEFGGSPSIITQPDGTLTTYAYTRHSDGGKTIIMQNGAATGNTVSLGKSTTAIYNRNGTVIRSLTETIGYPTNTVTDHSAVTSVDDFGRPLATAEFPAASSAPDGAVQASATAPKWTTATSYSCCGVASSTDRQGLVTTYEYDALRRQTKSTTLGVTTETVRKGLTTDTHRYPAGGGASTENLVSRSFNNMSGTQSSSWSPDPSSATAAALVETTTATSYEGSITTTITIVPGGASQTSQSYADGRTWKTTGNLSPPMIHSYAVNSTGLLTTSSYLAGTTPQETTTSQADWAGRTLTSTKGSATTTHAYNSLGQAISTTDADGVRALFAYNSLGESNTTAIDTNGNGSIDFNGTDRITVSTTAPGTYNGHPVMSSTSEVYATNGSATATTVATSHRTPDGLNSWSIALGVANPASRAIDPSTWTETTTNPDGTYVVTTQTNGRFDHSTNFASDATALHATAAGYDSLGRPVTSTDSRTGTTTTNYVSANCDAVASTTDAGNRVTSFTYDSNGRRLSTTLPDGTVSYISYHPNGQVAGTWGSQTYPTFTTYDYAGRKKTLRTQPTFASGVPINTGGSLTTWNYSADTGQLVSKQDAVDKGASYSYTPAGRLATRTWARGLVTTYGYTSGQLVSTNYSDATPSVSISFDRLGRQISVTQVNQSLFATTYDSVTLRPNKETIAYDLDHDGSYEFTRIIDRGQDTLGRDNGFQLKNGATVENRAIYGYSTADARLSNVVGGADDWSPQTFTYGYTLNSNLIASVTGPVNTVSNTWEPTRNVLASKQNKAGIDAISQYDYSVNVLGQRTGVNTSGTAFPALPNWAWGYDSLGQIISADSSLNTSDRAYQYDAIGNRKKSADSLTLPTTDNYTSNVLNQYSAVNSVSPSYDDDGNAIAYPLPVASTSNSSLTWDAENRLISTTVGTATTSYLYDSQARRIAKTSGGQTTLYVYDGWNVIAEYAGTLEQTTRTYLWGLDLSGSMQGAGGVGGLLAVKAGSSVHYPTFDGNGNVSEYIAADGSVAAHFEYDPFGSTVVNTDSGNLFPYRFSTKPQDNETGLYYYGFRDYDPVTGRWPSKDPIGENGGVNLYGFDSNDGVNRHDLLGLWTEVKRENGTWAKVCSDKDYDTWDELAETVRLDSFDADRWIQNYDGPWPTKGKTYLVPNLLVYYEAANSTTGYDEVPDWWNAGIGMLRGYGRTISSNYKKSGWKVKERIGANSRFEFINLWIEEGIGAMVFAGHGLSDPEDGTLYGFFAQDQAIGVLSEDVHPKYALSLVGALTCYSYENNWRRHVSVNGSALEYQGAAYFFSSTHSGPSPGDPNMPPEPGTIIPVF